jgi:hypothetical protein
MWPDIDVMTAQTCSSFESNFMSFTSNVCCMTCSTYQNVLKSEL